MTHPTYVARLKGSPDKRDYSDSRLLADLSRAGYLPRTWLAPAYLRDLRQLVHHRQRLVDQRRDLKLQIGAMLRDQRVKIAGVGRWSRAWVEQARTHPDLSAHVRWIIQENLAQIEHQSARNHPTLTRFYRFLFGYAVTPAKQFYMFGDVAPHWGPPNSALMRRVGRFDEEAARYAAWLLEGKNPPGHLLAYVLAPGPLPEPKVPGSRLFMDGAAVLREPADSPMSLGAMLYSIANNAEAHTHEEANALSLTGYGNRLLVNGGWLGDTTQDARMNNTLTIDGQRHQQRTGAGLTEGLLTEGFGYACGHSGKALGDDAFHRSLLLIHGQDGVSGYFVAIDQVDADPGESVHSHWQTANTTGLTPGLDPLEEGFAAPIDHHAQQPEVHLRILQAPKPADATVDTVPSGLLERSPKSGWHTRITTVHPTDAQGDRRILTVLHPWQQTERGESPVRLSRLEAPGVRRDPPRRAGGDARHRRCGRLRSAGPRRGDAPSSQGGAASNP